MKRIWALLLSAVLMIECGIIVCAAYPAHTGGDGVYNDTDLGNIDLVENSDATRCFSVDGHSFVWVDTLADGRYFIVANEYYGKGGFSKTNGSSPEPYPQKFDSQSENVNNAGVVMNSDAFLNALPEAIRTNLTVHDWEIEYATNFEDIQSGYTDSCKVAAPSMTELAAYADIIGYSITQSSTCLDYNGSAPASWVVRTPYYIESGANDRALKIFISNGGVSNSRDYSQALRPAFMLDKDFFNKAKIDTAGMGAVVRAELEAQELGIEDMLALGYSYADLAQLGYIELDESIELSDVKISANKLLPGYTLKSDYDYSGDTPEDTTKTSYTWYKKAADGEFTAIGGAVGSSYTITNNDAGKYIKVKIRPATQEGAVGDEFESNTVLIGAALDAPENKTYNRIEGHTADAPAEWLIVTESGTRLSLLDEVEENGEKLYFVIQDGVAGKSKAYSNIFDVNDTRSLAYALDEFYMGNNTEEDWLEWAGDGTSSVSGLEAAVAEHAVEYEYVTEAYEAGGKTSDYTTVTRASLLSYNEYKKYYNRFGYQAIDNGYWFLRTTRPDGDLQIVDNRVYTAEADLAKPGRIVKGAVGGDQYGIRPVFYLDADFFTDVKLNLSLTGSGVKNTIVANYTKDEMMSGTAGYKEAELGALGYEFARIEGLCFGGKLESGSSISAEFKYINTNPDALENVRYQWYKYSTDGGFEPVGGNEKTLPIDDDMIGSYIKVVVTPLTSYGEEGAPSEYISAVVVREAQEFEISLSSVTKADTTTASLSINKLTPEGKTVYLIMTAFDESNKPIATAVEEKLIQSGANTPSISISRIQQPTAVSVAVVDALDSIRPLFVKRA